MKVDVRRGIVEGSPLGGGSGAVGGSYWVEPRPGFEPGTSALPGRRSIKAELPRPPLDSLVLGGLICLCVFRVSYICYLLRVSGIPLSLGFPVWICTGLVLWVWVLLSSL